MTVDRILTQESFAVVAGPAAVAADLECIPLAFAIVVVQLGQPFAVGVVVAVVVAAPGQSSFALERHTRTLACYLNYV